MPSMVRHLSRRRLKEHVYPYLLRNVTARYPNHVWGIDITYIRMRGRMDVSGSTSGLVFPLCAQLGTGHDAGNVVCALNC
jgi:hypothetical protein